ncbi:hypothetical protein Patl1_16316 [Pistacia atlantica]|uniref:Uncharacterized protein n=1 Tax=Pistacia atlantica TaxID=434234 RepID=A0ACC1B888_9ROSI|nr:hypothetical protein Patl1_16316 [Pistacia atlantica]
MFLTSNEEIVLDRLLVLVIIRKMIKIRQNMVSKFAKTNAQHFQLTRVGLGTLLEGKP